MIVVDANLLVYLAMAGEYHDEAQDVLREDPEWIVPPLWRSEFLNAMLGHIRRGVLSEADALLAFRDAADAVNIEETPPEGSVLELAMKSGLSAYDAMYAALAVRLGIQNVTYDKQVLAAGLGIHPLDFLNQ